MACHREEIMYLEKRQLEKRQELLVADHNVEIEIVGILIPGSMTLNNLKIIASCL